MGESKGRDEEGCTREAYVTEMLHSRCGCADDSRRADCAIHSLPSGGERVQLYRAVQDMQSAVDACVDKYTL